MIISVIDEVYMCTVIVWGNSVFPGTMIYHSVKIRADYTV